MNDIVVIGIGITEDDLRTAENLGRYVTVLGKKNSNDQSYVGDVFQVVRFEDPLVVLQGVCDRYGNKNAIGKKRISFDMRKYNLRYVSKAYADALLNR